MQTIILWQGTIFQRGISVKNITQYYEAYDEDIRLVKDKAHALEFLTTNYVLESLIHSEATILDIGAGTGRYSFYYASKGHDVTSLELVQKHIDIMRTKLSISTSPLNMRIKQGTALDLSRFKDGSFDVVLVFGPLYHLISSEDRKTCINEALRVLKKNGLLAVAYVNRYMIFPSLALKDSKSSNSSLLSRIMDRGYVSSSEEDCFWTDAYFYTPEEIEAEMNSFKTTKVDHASVDGIGILLNNMVNTMTDEEYNVWLDYHFKSCRTPSLLGCGLHGLYVCRK